MAAVFVSASDESSGANHLSDFQCTGFVASEEDWTRFFAPAWQERVLDGPPIIPYLHVTDMRSRAWRAKYGITELDADNRLDEAARVIDAMGSLYPVKVKVKGPLFRKLFAPHKIIVASGAHKTYEPDYYAFIFYAYAVLWRVKIKFPDAEKVDFLVERKSTLTKHIHGLYETLPNALRHAGDERLIPLLGKFIPASKDRIPLQAADFLCWHSQRADAQTLDGKDAPRWNVMAQKRGFSFDVPEDLMRQFSEAFDRAGIKDEKHERVPKVRQNKNKGRLPATLSDAED